MVHYNGHLQLRVTNPTETLQQAAEFVDERGGYVEQRTDTSVTLRVPVAKFREVYARLAKLGEVLSRSMTAQDVTDQFVAMDLRVKAEGKAACSRVCWRSQFAPVTTPAVWGA